MVDLTFLKQFTKGDVNKMRRYIGIYLNVAPQTFLQMKKNLDEKDWEQLRINAHSLKPQSDYMGIEQLKLKLVQIENDVKNQHYDGLTKLVEEALIIHDESEVLLKDAMGESH